jgi:hypothetical protein
VPKPPEGAAPSSGARRTLRRSQCMYQLYTSPRTPADGIRRLRRPQQPGSSAGPMASPSTSPSTMSSSSVLPPNGGGVATPTDESSASAWDSPMHLNVSEGHAMYDLRGNEVRASSKGIVCVAPSAESTQAATSQPAPINTSQAAIMAARSGEMEV